MASTQLRFNHQSYSQLELEIACALRIWLRKSDETIGTILGARRYGTGGPPIPCAGLVAFLQGSSHAVYRRVSNNGAYWEPEAQRVYQDWMGASCMERDTSVDAHDQDSTHPNVVSTPALGFEGRSRLSVEPSSKHLPLLIGEGNVLVDGHSWSYENGTTSKKALDNAQSSVNEALTPRTRLSGSCIGCRRMKTRCDRAAPKCSHCVRLGRDCLPTLGPRSRAVGSLELTEEVRKHEQPRFLGSEQSLNDEDPRASFPRLPNLSVSPTSSKFSSRPIQAVPGLAHNLSLTPQHRKRLPEWGPQHAGNSQLTDGLLSVTALQPLRSYGATPLRTLLAKYYLLDAISQVKLENVNSCLDVVHTEPPIRPLAESVTRLYAMPPKAWLAIRRMIRNLYTDVLHDILDIITDAKLYTDYVLFHTSSRPTLGPIEQAFAGPALFDCVRVRQYMLNMLFRELQVFILKLRHPRVESGKESYPDVPSPSARQSSATSVPVEERMAQASRNSKRLLQAISRRIWDRILHPTVQASLTAMVYSRLYESLQYTLYRSSWPPILARSLASGRRSLSLRTGPFPGLWTCKTGVILWKQATQSPKLRVFSLHHDRRVPVQELTKCYWHFTFGSNAFAGNHRSLLLRLLRRHKVFLQLYGPGNSVTHDEKSGRTYSKSPANHVVEGKRAQNLTSSTVYSSVISFIHIFVKHTVGSLRIWGCSEPPLAEGKARVRWRCKCGRRLYDDFDEQRPGAAKAFEKLLNESTKQRPVIDNSQTSMRSTVQNILGIFQNIPGNRTFTNNNHPLEQRSQAYDPRPQNATHTVIRGCDMESRWLLVCAKGKKRPTTLSQLDICTTPSDKELFTELKKAYVGLRGKWTHVLSLKKIQSIRFVQFELHIRDLVDIRKVPDMPPETKKDEYLYQPYDLVPPVGENLMAHLFHHPEDANDTSITCLRAPKKRKVKLTVCPRQGTSVGWGIHLVEGWVVSRLWLLGLMLFITGSLVFAVCWTVFRHDLQGAFSVAAYIVTLMGTVFGTSQAGLG